jgi:glyoxylase-like metal-dependent hydrolase (beta-lactamase superfamily II)
MADHYDSHILIVGSGSAFSTKFHQTGILIITPRTHLLVDFGMTGPRAYNELVFEDKPPLDQIENVFITHSHADHVGGLEYLALLNRYVAIPYKGAKKLNLLITEEYQRILWENTLRGGLEYNATEGAEQRKLLITDYFRLTRPTWVSNNPRETWQFELEDLKLQVFRTKHIPDSANGWSDSFISYGILINDEILFTGDTQFDPDLLAMFPIGEDGVHTVIHDCQLFKGGVHASLEELSSLPASIRQHIYGIHYGDNVAKEQGFCDGQRGAINFAYEGQAFHFHSQKG